MLIASPCARAGNNTSETPRPTKLPSVISTMRKIAELNGSELLRARCQQHDYRRQRRDPVVRPKRSTKVSGASAMTRATPRENTLW